MNRGELIKVLSTRAELSQEAVKRVLTEFADVVGTAVKSGDDVSISGFGVFKRSIKKARVGRNPLSGEQINIPEKRVITFKPGKELRDVVDAV
jgi:DNA-binding protein HU-beta